MVFLGCLNMDTIGADGNRESASTRLPWLLPSLQSPGQVLGNLGPNWFASVMGTGIVATAAATLPVRVPGLQIFARVVWVLAALLLVVLSVAVAAHWLRHPTVARSHAHNPQMAHFYGAAPMALLTVGAGALLVGEDLIGQRAAVDLDWMFWSAGTLGGLFTAMTIPYLMFTQHNVEPDAAFGGWLMPVVPPMVSAATGALLIPHLGPGSGRETMLYGCYAMFGLSLFASVVIITMVWSRLAHFGTSGTSRVPTLWIVLGPLGQSITAAGLLGTNAALAVTPQLADGMGTFAILFGVPIWGFAVLWIALATALTVRTARRGMPFALTWWSLTFPVGTFVTGTTQLAVHTGLPAFRVAAAIAYVGLLGTWILVAVRTARGGLRGNLFLPPPGAGPIKAQKDAPARSGLS
jgi:C4-dicarboxylate transporter/malic acid transport protein